MAKRVQHIRHDTSGADAFTGFIGEITADTDRNELRLHDGSTAGGHRILNKTQLDTAYQARNDNKFVLNASEVVVNDAGAAVDFRVETAAITDALLVDASADKIITNAPIDFGVGSAVDFKLTANQLEAVSGSIILLPNGSAAAPVLTISGNTGIYFASGEVNIAVAGVQRGNMTASALSWLTAQQFGGQIQQTNAYDGASAPAQFISAFSRGTIAVPTASQSDDVLGRWRARGHDGTSYRDAAYIEAIQTGAVGNPSTVAALRFLLTNSAGSALTERHRFSYLTASLFGTAPSGWAGTVLPLHVGSNAFFAGNSAGPVAYVGSNLYFDGSDWKHAETNAAGYMQFNGSSGDFAWVTAPSAAADAAATRTTRMTLTNAGWLLVGVTSGSQHILSGAVASNRLYDVINTSATSPSGMQIKLSGASPDNNTQYFFQCADSTATRIIGYSDGDLQNHDNSYGAISDRALKQDVVYVGPFANDNGEALPVEEGDSSYISLIKKFRPSKFRFITDVEADINAGKMLGLIAQDVLKFAPGLVQGEGTEEVPYGLQYSLISMQLVPAMQEIIVKQEDHEERISALEAA